MQEETKLTDKEMVILLHDIARTLNLSSLRNIADRLNELSKNQSLTKDQKYV